MKILFVLPQIYPFLTGGAEIFHFYLIKSLAQKSKVGYIGFDNINNSEITFYKIKKIKPLKFFVPIQTIYLLIRYKSKFDVVHLNFCQSSWVHWFYYPILKRLFNIEYGLTIHDGSMKIWKAKRIFKRVFNEAKFVVAVSERLKYEYESRCERVIEYIPPLVPLIRNIEAREYLLESIGLKSGDKAILFVGSLKMVKRPDLIIEALRLIDRDWLMSKSIKVLIAGSGNLEEFMKIKIKENGLSDIVIMLGRISHEHLNIYYKLSSLYIITSIHEGKSISLIEAMFNKIPIIASNAPGISDIIFHGKNGLLFNIDDPADLANCVKSLIEDEALAENLSNSALHDYNRYFLYNSMLDRYLKLYK